MSKNKKSIVVKQSRPRQNKVIGKTEQPCKMCAVAGAEDFMRRSPVNDREEKELLLAKMIFNEEQRLIDLESKAEAAKWELEKLDLDRQVHSRVMADKQANKDWQYYFSEDHYFTVTNRLKEIKDDLEYLNAYLRQARQMIKSEKYKNLPEDFFYHCHWDFEDVDFWSDGHEAADSLPESP